MRELFLVEDESTSTSLVLRADDGEQFFVAVEGLSDAVRNLVNIPLEAPVVELESEPKPESEPQPKPTPVSRVVDHSAEREQRERSLPTPDPLMTAPLTLRPRDIQGRIRAGASITELAEEMGVAESRVEPFAHPVVLERARIAELAKQSHPVREDGPAKLTLWEVLATAFAARGHSVADTNWDSYREVGGHWIIRVTWQAGLSENLAEWAFINPASSSSTTEARNPIAADLTDPDFVQHVRTLTSVGRGNRFEEQDLDEDDFEGDGRAEGEEVAPRPDDAAEEEPAPQTRRRRKAVTPHWEDVLLGVRTNTKRPRN